MNPVLEMELRQAQAKELTHEQMLAFRKQFLADQQAAAAAVSQAIVSGQHGGTVTIERVVAVEPKLAPKVAAWLMHALSRFVSSQAGVTSAQFVGLFFAVLLVVVGVYLAEPLLDASVSIMGHASITSFPLVSVIIQFLPVIYIVGLFGVAGAIGVMSWRGGR